MPQVSILEGIWSGAIRPARRRVPCSSTGTTRSEPTIFLEHLYGDMSPTALIASEELEPGLTVADILAEEFDMMVPDEAMVVLLPAKLASRRVRSRVSMLAPHIIGALNAGTETPKNVH